MAALAAGSTSLKFFDYNWQLNAAPSAPPPCTESLADLAATINAACPRPQSARAGVPTSCPAGCAAAFVPGWRSCAHSFVERGLGREQEQAFDAFAQTCEVTMAPPPPVASCEDRFD
eukprot:SAG11_NODE_6343_length_1332_cov_1.543390_3_plen_116_part_01